MCAPLVSMKMQHLINVCLVIQIVKAVMEFLPIAHHVHYNLVRTYSWTLTFVFRIVQMVNMKIQQQDNANHVQQVVQHAQVLPFLIANHAPIRQLSSITTKL